MRRAFDLVVIWAAGQPAEARGRVTLLLASAALKYASRTLASRAARKSAAALGRQVYDLAQAQPEGESK